MHILSFNVRRSGPCHDAALAQAASQGATAVLIQEPWTRNQTTKNLRGFKLWGPTTQWSPRPRSFIYTNSQHEASQLPTVGPDAVGVRCAGITVYSIYNEPGRDVSWVPSLFSLQRGPFLLAGDFNARHPTWASWTQPSAGSDHLLNNLPRNTRLLNPPDIPTHNRGGVLDLAWANISGATATVSEYHTVGSDHLPLHITIPPLTTVKRFTHIRCPNDALAEQMCLSLQLPPQHNLLTAEDIDEAAHQLQECATRAYSAACTRPTSGKVGVPWWQPQLTGIRQEAKRTGDWLPFHTAVNRAKAKHWTQTINNATKPAEVWQIGHWRHKRNPLNAPPLQTEEGPVVDGKARAQLFLQRLLTKAAKCSASTLEGPPIRHLPPILPPSSDEVRECVLGPTSTAPGCDLLTIHVLRAMWARIGSRIQAIYDACLSLGHHPACWKEARVEMIPKPGKDDVSNPRNWRPISLLSCLSKGLERYVARWMAYHAIKENVISATHFGALPRRATLDLVINFVSRIEAALQEGKHAALLLQDVEGAFDGVSHDRLLSRLRLQGWAPETIKWIRSWLHERTVTVTVPGGQASGVPKGGVPQGSPLSPILFALYVEPIAWATNRGIYADDMATLVVARTLDGVDAGIQQAQSENAMLATECGVDLAPEKEECQRFTRKRKVPDHWKPTCTRWLGMHLDTKLTFREHIRKWAGKAKQSASFIRSLGNTARGLPPLSARKLVQGCVLPIAFYGAEVLWS